MLRAAGSELQQRHVGASDLVFEHLGFHWVLYQRHRLRCFPLLFHLSGNIQKVLPFRLYKGRQGKNAG